MVGTRRDASGETRGSKEHRKGNKPGVASAEVDAHTSNGSSAAISLTAPVRIDTGYIFVVVAEAATARSGLLRGRLGLVVVIVVVVVIDLELVLLLVGGRGGAGPAALLQAEDLLGALIAVGAYELDGVASGVEALVLGALPALDGEGAALDEGLGVGAAEKGFVCIWFVPAEKGVVSWGCGKEREPKRKKKTEGLKKKGKKGKRTLGTPVPGGLGLALEPGKVDAGLLAGPHGVVLLDVGVQLLALPGVAGAAAGGGGGGGGTGAGYRGPGSRGRVRRFLGGGHVGWMFVACCFGLSVRWVGAVVPYCCFVFKCCWCCWCYWCCYWGCCGGGY